MSHLMDKVSYLRGLMEGIKLDTATPEGTLIAKIVDVLEGMAGEMTTLREDQEELSDFVDTLDEDLSEIEDTLFDEEDADDYIDEDEGDEEAGEDDFECGGDCESCSGCEDDGEEYQGEILVECMCPECNGAIYVREDELGEDAYHICPRCGARIHVVPDFQADIPVARLASDGERDE